MSGNGGIGLSSAVGGGNGGIVIENNHGVMKISKRNESAESINIQYRKYYRNKAAVAYGENGGGENW
jgi:hypothetical protein